jgi:hypothetical protein
MSGPRWGPPFEPDSTGHRYFEDLLATPPREVPWRLWHVPPLEHRVGVADQSGETPDQTDDGVLYLDVSRPVVGPVGQGYYLVPLLTPGGRETSTPATRKEAFAVTARYNMALDEEGGPR